MGLWLQNGRWLRCSRCGLGSTAPHPWTDPCGFSLWVLPCSWLVVAAVGELGAAGRQPWPLFPLALTVLVLHHRGSLQRKTLRCLQVDRSRRDVPMHFPAGTPFLRISTMLVTFGLLDVSVPSQSLDLPGLTWHFFNWRQECQTPETWEDSCGWTQFKDAMLLLCIIESPSLVGAFFPHGFVYCTIVYGQDISSPTGTYQNYCLYK